MKNRRRSGTCRPGWQHENCSRWHRLFDLGAAHRNTFAMRSGQIAIADVGAIQQSIAQVVVTEVEAVQQRLAQIRPPNVLVPAPRVPGVTAGPEHGYVSRIRHPASILPSLWTDGKPRTRSLKLHW